MSQELLLKSGEIAQFIGGLFMIVTYIPQIAMLAKSKSAENQSKSFWILLIISLATFTYNALLLFIFKGVASVLVTQGLNLLLALIILTQVIIYGKRDK